MKRIFLLAWLLAAVAARADLAEGLVAHLPLRADLRDHSAQALPVKISGRVVIRNGAGFFEGKEDWLELPFIPLHDRPFAVATWLKPVGDFPTYGLLHQWDRDVPNHILHLMIRDGWRPWFGFYMNDCVSPLSLSNAGAWQHVVFQFTGTAQEIWINGRLISHRKGGAYKGKAGATCIGRTPTWNNVPARHFTGYLSDFRIYTRTLTFAEISEIASRPPDAPAEAPALAAARSPQPPGSVAPAGTSEVPVLSIDGGSMRLRGRPGEDYVVEASSDLEKWEELGKITLGAEGFADFVDEDVARFRQRFYRLRYRVPP